MLKPLRISAAIIYTQLLLGALIAVPLFSTSVRADQDVPEGEIYRGDGYTVFLVGAIALGLSFQRK